jgi:hypothetical protein
VQPQAGDHASSSCALLRPAGDRLALLMRKVDFLVQAPEGEVFTDVAVGQKLQLVHQEDHSWACARQDGSIVCPVPPDGAAALRGNAAATAAAAVRSVKRAPDQPTAAVSLQVRITFPPPGARHGWQRMRWCREACLRRAPHRADARMQCLHCRSPPRGAAGPAAGGAAC